MTTHTLTHEEMSDPKTPAEQLAEVARQAIEARDPITQCILAKNPNTPLESLFALFCAFAASAVMCNEAIPVEAIRDPLIYRKLFAASHENGQLYLTMGMHLDDTLSDPSIASIWSLTLITFIASETRDIDSKNPQHYGDFFNSIFRAGQHPELRDGPVREELAPLYGVELIKKFQEQSFQISEFYTEGMGSPRAILGAQDILKNYAGNQGQHVRAFALAILGHALNRQHGEVAATAQEELIHGTSLRYLESPHISALNASQTWLHGFASSLDAQIQIAPLLRLATRLMDAYPVHYQPFLSAVRELLPPERVASLSGFLHAYARQHSLREKLKNIQDTIPLLTTADASLFRDLGHLTQDPELRALGRDIDQECRVRNVVNLVNGMNEPHRVLRFHATTHREQGARAAVGIDFHVTDTQTNQEGPKIFRISHFGLYAIPTWLESLTPLTPPEAILHALAHFGTRLPNPPPLRGIFRI